MQISNSPLGVFPLKPTDNANRLSVVMPADVSFTPAPARNRAHNPQQVVPVSTAQDSQQARFIRILAQLDNAEFLPTQPIRALPAPVVTYLQIASLQDRSPYSGLIDETV
ncbi:MAG: hypothetical protein RQ732_00455 [Methylophaga sp.]|nr:hypothetical protein [Methylophaga sp.]